MAAMHTLLLWTPVRQLFGHGMVRAIPGSGSDSSDGERFGVCSVQLQQTCAPTGIRQTSSRTSTRVFGLKLPLWSSTLSLKLPLLSILEVAAHTSRVFGRGASSVGYTSLRDRQS